MAQHSVLIRRHSVDILASRIIKYWLLLECLLTSISLILIFFLPKSAGGFFGVVTCAISITVMVGMLLFYRYDRLEDVKNKRVYRVEKVNLINKISKVKTELSVVEQALADNQAHEVQEIESNLQKLEKEHIETGLRQAKIDDANIPGVGPKLTERLTANRISSAADVGMHIHDLEGFGNAKVQALVNWKQAVLARLNSTKPDRLPEAQLFEIRQKHKRQKEQLIKTRESHQLKQTELNLELDSVKLNLTGYKEITFINYLGTNLLGGVRNQTLQKSTSVITLGVIGLGMLIHGSLGLFSGGALMAASIPTQTPTYTATFTPPPTSTSMPSSTLTLTPSATATRTPTVTPTPTITLTPSITPTPTVTPTATIPFTPSPTLPYTISACVPKNTLRQVGSVVDIRDGDTVEVRLEDGNVYPVRYIGMDTAEQGETGYWPSANKNSELVYGKTVTLIKDVSEVDRYDRLLRYVVVGNVFVNNELVIEGLAKAAQYPPDTACAATFSSSEEYARSHLLGMWVATPVPQPTIPDVNAPCSCSGNLYNCDDFSSHAAAQACYDYCMSVGAGDVHRLDGNHDGNACESLP